MAEVTTPRLMAAAKELNIGKDTLVDFLISKGFEDGDMKPTSKLTEPMYRALQSEFQQDKAAHEKAMQIDLPKAVIAGEAKKKKDEQDLSFTKKETAKTTKPVAEEKKEEPVIVIEEKTIPEARTEEQLAETEKATLTKVKAPAIEKPKVVDKIDLDAIDSSTRPKKATKKTTGKESEKAEEQKIEETKKAKTDVPKKEVAEVKPEIPVPKPEVKEEEAPVIENIKARKLSGPKIMGKIDLPVDNDTRPKKDADEKRKRYQWRRNPVPHLHRATAGGREALAREQAGKTEAEAVSTEVDKLPRAEGKTGL